MERFTGFLRRLRALVKKEFLQLTRDQSSLLMGIVLPLMLIFIMGYGMSLDVKNVPVAVVLEDTSPTARDMVSFTQGSEYFNPTFTHSMPEAIDLMKAHKVDVIFRVPSTFTEDLYRGDSNLQVLLNGVESTKSTSASSYIQSSVLTWVTTRTASSIAVSSVGQVNVVSRIWFNDANTSAWFYVPGILMLVLTIVGVFLTAVVMAREWERGTFESLFVTPVQILEIILAKLIPYFGVAWIGLTLCLTAGHYLFDVPLRGSIIVIMGVSMLYLLVALGIGLVISAIAKNQFLASQMALYISFLPSIMLSGFMFDLHSEPVAIQVISHFFPTTYYLQLLKSLLLTGNYWPLIVKNTSILLGYMIFFFFLAFYMTRKKVN